MPPSIKIDNGLRERPKQKKSTNDEQKSWHRCSWQMGIVKSIKKRLKLRLRLRMTTSKWDKQLEKRKFECITKQCSVRTWAEENKMLYFPFLALFPSIFSHCIYIIFVYHRNKSPFGLSLLPYFLYLLLLFLHFVHFAFFIAFSCSIVLSVSILFYF